MEESKLLSQRNVQKLQKSTYSHGTELSIWQKIHERVELFEALLHDSMFDSYS